MQAHRWQSCCQQRPSEGGTHIAQGLAGQSAGKQPLTGTSRLQAGLSGKKIGVQKGTTGKTYAEENAPKDAQLIEFPSDGELWPAIQAGQIDAILQDQPVNHTHEVADAAYKIVETYSTDEQYGFAFAKDKKPELLKAVNDQLKAMRADGSYDTIYKKYFG